MPVPLPYELNQRLTKLKKASARSSIADQKWNYITPVSGPSINILQLHICMLVLRGRYALFSVFWTSVKSCNNRNTFAIEPFFLTKTCMQRIFFFFKFGQRLKRTRDTLFPSKDCDIGNPVLPCAASCLTYRSSKRYAVSKSMRSPHFSVFFLFFFILVFNLSDYVWCENASTPCSR